MVHYCCCFGCNEKFVKGGGITFHSFPKNEARRRIWLQNIQRKNFVPSAFSKVCSKHFEEECFDKEKFGGVWLKADAVPTIFNFPKDLTPESKSPIQRLLYDKQTELRNEENDIATTQAGNIQISCEALRRKRCRYISDLNEEDMTSPSKVKKAFGIARMQVADQRRRNQVLEIKTTGYKRKMNALSTLLEELRQKVNLSHDVYSVSQTSLPDLSKQLVLRALPESKKGADPQPVEQEVEEEEVAIIQADGDTGVQLQPVEDTMANTPSADDSSPGASRVRQSSCVTKASVQNNIAELVSNGTTLSEQEMLLLQKKYSAELELIELKKRTQILKQELFKAKLAKLQQCSCHLNKD